MIVFYGYMIYWAVAAIGITYGYHRYFAHGTWKSNALVETILLYLGLICGGRSALTWSGVHRMHHAYADTENDPLTGHRQTTMLFLYFTICCP